MSDYWQLIIVAIVVTLALFLAARSIYRAVTHKKSALNQCSLCKLKDCCDKSHPSQGCNDELPNEK